MWLKNPRKIPKFQLNNLEIELPKSASALFSKIRSEKLESPPQSTVRNIHLYLPSNNRSKSDVAFKIWTRGLGPWVKPTLNRFEIREQPLTRVEPWVETTWNWFWDRKAVANVGWGVGWTHANLQIEQGNDLLLLTSHSFCWVLIYFLLTWAAHGTYFLGCVLLSPTTQETQIK